MRTPADRFQSEIDRNQTFLKEQVGILSDLAVAGKPSDLAYETLKRVASISKASSILQVYSQVLNVLQKEGVEETRKYVQERVNRNARNPLRSTDPVSNLQSTQELEYLSEALDILAAY